MTMRCLARIAAASGLLGLLAACTTLPAGPPVPAPVLGVGDHWLYRITDNLRRGQVTMLDAQVVSVAGGSATVHLVHSGAYGISESTEEVNAAGGLIVGALKDTPPRHFPTAIEMFRFPLQTGETWRQVVNTISPETQLPAQILVFGTVLGQAVVTVPAGTFNATYVYRILQLDDEEFWRTRTTRNDSVWFSPEVKGPVRELRDAYYIWRDGGVSPVVRTENTTRELVSFQAGKP